MKEKLKKYFERMSPIITCAAALNPCFNVQGVEFLIESISTNLNFFDDSYATKAKNGSPTRLKWEGVVNPKNKTHSGVLRDVYVLKRSLGRSERKQDKSTLETPVDFEEEILDAGVQANEAIPLSDEEIALDAASSECSMSGPGSKGEEVEVNYGYDVYHDDY
nr:squalene synthase [Tanacetum cinerariifolium]